MRASRKRDARLTDFALLADGEDLAALEASDGADAGSRRGHRDAAEEVHGASDRHFGEGSVKVVGGGDGLVWMACSVNVSCSGECCTEESRERRESSRDDAKGSSFYPITAEVMMMLFSFPRGSCARPELSIV